MTEQKMRIIWNERDLLEKYKHEKPASCCLSSTSCDYTKYGTCAVKGYEPDDRTSGPAWDRLKKLL